MSRLALADDVDLRPFCVSIIGQFSRRRRRRWADAERQCAAAGAVECPLMGAS